MITTHEWKEKCSTAARETNPVRMIKAASDLLALARRAYGVACQECRGYGRRSYSSTSTWRGGMGGASITIGECDICWGTGRTDVTGPDLRMIEQASQEKEREFRQKEFEEWIATNIGRRKQDQFVLRSIIGFLGRESRRRKVPEGADEFFYKRACEWLVCFFERIMG
jgi:hypothetical protein